MFTKIYDKVKVFLKENYKFIIGLAIGIFIFLFELPYAVYTPGGLVPLEDRIEIDGGYDSKGSFNMSYVSLRKGNIPTILFSYIIPNWDLVKKSDITIDDESIDELLKLEKLYMKSSIDNATIVAYNKAGKKIEKIEKVQNIVHIAEEAETDLKVYDVFKKIDGNIIETVEDLRSYVATKKAGDIVNIEVLRDGKEKNCTARVYKNDDRLLVGVSLLTTYDIETEPEINVKTKSSESGSSGGLMLTLAIYNALVPEDLTNGKTIVGTGTIDEDGNVGAIDGIKYKILGAVKNKADLFLCPIDNYDEAIKVKNELDLDIRIEKVATFDEALEAIK